MTSTVLAKITWVSMNVESLLVVLREVFRLEMAVLDACTSSLKESCRVGFNFSSSSSQCTLVLFDKNGFSFLFCFFAVDLYYG
jgi:hypothetical protein